jgi:pyruvate dehydrogenase E1 component beta subunit
MKYKEALKSAFNNLAEDPLTRFIGYNLKFGSKHYGIMEDIEAKKIIETPVAENLMVGMAVGMALERLKPVVIFERHDFILNAMDALINHLDKASELSNGKFNPKVIIKATVGCKKPFDPGIQHIQEYTEELKSMCTNINVVTLYKTDLIIDSYSKAINSKSSTILIDYRILYDSDSK